MCSYPCFGLSKTGFTPPSQLFKTIQKSAAKTSSLTIQEIDSENYVAADSEFDSDDGVIYIYIYIGCLHNMHNNVLD